MIQKKAPPATEQETRAHKMRQQVQVTKSVGTLSSESRLYPFYSDIKQVAPDKFLSLADLVCMAIDPSIGPKNKAAALTPFNASAKRKEVALISEFTPSLPTMTTTTKPPNRSAPPTTLGAWLIWRTHQQAMSRKSTGLPASDGSQLYPLPAP